MNKKYIISLLISVFIVSTSVVFTLYQYKYRIKQPTPSFLSIPIDPKKTVAESYNNWLETEEKKIWHELSSQIRLSQQECSQLKAQWYENYKNGEQKVRHSELNKHPLSTATQQRVASILADFNLSYIPLVSWKDSSVASATDSFLFINERAFNKLSPQAQKFIIGHEVQHYIHKDCSTNYVIKRFFRKALGSLPKEHPVNKLSRFQEIRADVKSSIKNKEYAQGYVEFMQLLMKKRENSGITHPKNSLRFSIAQELSHNVANQVLI